MATTAHTLTKTAYTAIVSTAGVVNILFSPRAKRADFGARVEIVVATSAPTVPTNNNYPIDASIELDANTRAGILAWNIKDGETVYARWLSTPLTDPNDMKIVTA